jgi:hypothetical protein
VRPEGTLEIGISIFNMLIACGVYAYCIGRIMQIFDELNKTEQILTKNMYVINNYLQK